MFETRSRDDYIYMLAFFGYVVLYRQGPWNGPIPQQNVYKIHSSKYHFDSE